MKTSFFLTILLLLPSYFLFAQHPLEGSWELVSSTITHKDGKKQVFDANNTNEVLIFTPTHMAIITETDDANGGRTYSNSMIGTYEWVGGKYRATPIMAS